MRRILSAILILFLVPSLFLNVLAANDTAEADILYLEDGSYICIEIFSADLRVAERKIGHKTYTFYNEDSEEQWSATLTGSFTYTGTSVTCTSASCSVKITETVWSVESKSTERNGNAAIAKLIMKQSKLGASAIYDDITIKLTCDKNGNLS